MRLSCQMRYGKTKTWRKPKMMTIEDMKALVDRLYAEVIRYSTISQIHQNLTAASDIISHYVKLVENNREM